MQRLTPSGAIGILVTAILGGVTWYYCSNPGIYEKLWVIVGHNAAIYVAFAMNATYAIYRWHKNPEGFTILEAPVQIAATTIAIALIYPLFYYTSANIDDVEIWNGHATSAIHEEAWTERGHKTCDTHDSKGKVTGHYDCSYNQFHPPAWSVRTSNGSTETFNTNTSVYDAYVSRFGNQRQTGTGHAGQISVGDGRTFETDYHEGDTESLVPTAAEHAYVNYVKGAQLSLHRRSLGNEKGFEKFFVPYPCTHPGPFGPVEFNHVIVKGAPVPDAWMKAVDERLDRELAYLGKTRQVNVMVYVVGTDDRSFLPALDAKWANGKKNDVTVIVGAPAFPEVAWADIQAWTETDLFHVSLRDAVEEMKDVGDADAFIDTIVNQVKLPPGKGGYDRKPMEEYEYLASEIELPLWAHAFVWIICGSLAWILGWALENNDFRDGGSGSYDHNYSSPRSYNRKQRGY